MFGLLRMCFGRCVFQSLLRSPRAPRGHFLSFLRQLWQKVANGFLEKRAPGPNGSRDKSFLCNLRHEAIFGTKKSCSQLTFGLGFLLSATAFCVVPWDVLLCACGIHQKKRNIKLLRIKRNQDTRTVCLIRPSGSVLCSVHCCARTQGASR